MMVVIIGVATVLLAILLTSKLWMYDDDPINQTPFNQVIKQLDQTDITLKKWAYNEEQNFMEVIIEKKHTGTDLIKPTFKYVGKEAEKNQQLPTKIIFESDNMVVLELHELPQKFKYITVAMDEYRDEETVKVEQGMVEEDGKEVKPKRYVFVGDYRKITTDNKLKTRPQKEYEKENIRVEIKGIEKQIAYITDEKVPLKTKGVLEIEQDIKALEDEVQFATEEEKALLERDIYAKKEAIKTALREKEKLEDEVANLEEKIVKLKEKIAYLDGGENSKSLKVVDPKNEVNKEIQK